MFILLHGFAKTVQYTVFTFSHKTIKTLTCDVTFSYQPVATVVFIFVWHASFG